MKKLLIMIAIASVFAITPLAGFAQAAQSAHTETTETETVSNPEFQKYFADNSQLQVKEDGTRTEGTVVVEFRVNAYGVPSAIQVVSGFSRETNREVIDLLVKGPKWTPTDGKRIRTVVEYK